MNELVLILGMALATMATRIPVLLLLSRVRMSEGIFRALRYVPASVLSAIILPFVLLRENQLWVAADNAPLIASLAAVAVAWRRRNLLLTIVVGMALMLGWRVFFSS
ncbi:MAG: AzlD domain-containing protein [Anaerolineales bacterium]